MDRDIDPSKLDLSKAKERYSIHLKKRHRFYEKPASAKKKKRTQVVPDLATMDEIDLSRYVSPDDEASSPKLSQREQSARQKQKDASIQRAISAHLKRERQEKETKELEAKKNRVESARKSARQSRTSSDIYYAGKSLIDTETPIPEGDDDDESLPQIVSGRSVQAYPSFLKYEKSYNQRERAELKLIKQIKELQEQERLQTKVDIIKLSKHRAMEIRRTWKEKQEGRINRFKEELKLVENALHERRIEMEKERISTMKRIKSENEAREKRRRNYRFAIAFNRQNNMISRQLLMREIARRREETLEALRAKVRERKLIDNIKKSEIETLWFKDLNRKRAMALYSKQELKRISFSLLLY